MVQKVNWQACSKLIYVMGLFICSDRCARLALFVHTQLQCAITLLDMVGVCKNMYKSVRSVSCIFRRLNIKRCTIISISNNTKALHVDIPP